MHFQEMMESELNKGIEQGIEQGIEAFILDKLEDGISHETIVQRLMKRFKLTQDQAIERLNKYL